jgi:hypothetical protein
VAEPGEVPQAIGRAYVLALVGSLEQSVAGFRRLFDVETNAAKLSFRLPSGAFSSFDVSGVLERRGWPPREVLIECKGHRDGNRVFDGYRTFLGNAFFVSTTIERHADDWFWFATNVPFGSSVGRRLTDYDFVRGILEKHTEASPLLKSVEDPVALIHGFLPKVAVCIFPDSFMRLTGVRYWVKQDDNIWSILQKLHGGEVPFDDFQSVAASVARANQLANPDVIVPETPLQLPWNGVRWD